MKTDFSINVQVNLGITPELVRLMGAILNYEPTTTPTPEGTLGAQAQAEEKPESNTPAAPQPPTAKQGGKKKKAQADTKPSGNEAAGDGESPEVKSSETDTKEADEAADQATAETKEADRQADTPKELTEEDVRAAIHKTRQRIEGEDYKEHTDSDAYKKYHRVLTAEFKNISALLGADKPSALPAGQRANFIKRCDDLRVMEDGKIGTQCPY